MNKYLEVDYLTCKQVDYFLSQVNGYCPTMGGYLEVDEEDQSDKKQLNFIAKVDNAFAKIREKQQEAQLQVFSNCKVLAPLLTATYTTDFAEIEIKAQAVLTHQDRQIIKSVLSQFSWSKYWSSGAEELTESQVFFAKASEKYQDLIADLDDLPYKTLGRYIKRTLVYNPLHFLLSHGGFDKLFRLSKVVENDVFRESLNSVKGNYYAFTDLFEQFQQSLVN